MDECHEIGLFGPFFAQFSVLFGNLGRGVQETGCSIPRISAETDKSEPKPAGHGFGFVFI